ncbi:diaminopimelate epimerase [Lottiidibacillus patelloidae]|uniref:Diaminopimelate epimerase n=1 Tax=Lottiidibacillus patelloidae TaxID=2670334 RepID=A0A263BPS3_9BACI|nr:diaminopimelate epimerase [Lottiidibacillus patelloidae]OZM55743.1 diaminopimelate epimerase [Lottiidibacillus patelloidae]
MNTIKFTKMHGLGNNYIYINCFEETLREEELSSLAISLADQNRGIGSDGMILICPSATAEVKMRIFNSDGSEGKNCGNGLRCVAKYAYENNLVNTDKFYIETLGGIVQAHVHNEGKEVSKITVDMGMPRLKKKDLPMEGLADSEIINEEIVVGDEQLLLTGVSMGNPHGVIFVDDINKAPVTSIGPMIEKMPIFPEGINVEFVEVTSETEMHFRVWERGSGVTQACGTGACAAVVAASLHGKVRQGEDVTVHLLGGDLIINWTEDGNVLMTGPAETICDGVYYMK